MTLDELNDQVAQAQVVNDLAEVEYQAEMARVTEKRKAAGLALERALKEFYDAVDATRLFSRAQLEHDSVTE